MDARPAVPGNDSSTSGFEGFANKEESTGKSLFHAKHSVQAAGTPAKTAPPGFSVSKRAGKSTPASFVKKIGD
jgi:hypothetical protein